MIVKRIGPLSLAKVSGLLYAIMGFIIGCVLALVATLGGAATQTTEGPVLGALFGVGAVFFLPILYGSLGFLGSLLMAALYNLAAGAVGGIELHLEQGPPPGGPAQGA